MDASGSDVGDAVSPAAGACCSGFGCFELSSEACQQTGGTFQGDGTVCTDTEASQGVCLFRCTSAQECRDWLGSGYTCDEESNLTTGEDVRVCIDA